MALPPSPTGGILTRLRQELQADLDKAKVTVWVPPLPPYIQEGPDLTVKESMEVSFTCISRGGKPAAKVRTMSRRGRDQWAVCVCLKVSLMNLGGSNICEITRGIKELQLLFRCEVPNLR